METNYKIYYEQCHPEKGNKKGKIIILTSDLCGEKVGDIEYMKGSTFETSGNYRITKIIDVAAERRRLIRKQTIEQVRADERKRFNELKAAFATADFEFFCDAFENRWSIEQAKVEYEKPSDERSQQIAVAKPTKDTSQQTKLTEKLLGQERQRFRALLNAFDFDQDFVLSAFERGLMVETAAEEYFAPEKQSRSAGCIVFVNEDSSSGDQEDFVAVGKELARAEGIKLGEALKRVARKNPELHQAYKEKCYGQN